MKIGVVGGGISGLTVAHKLVLSGHDVTCFEGGGRIGGLIRTERHEGFMCEVGPQAILDGGRDVRALFEELGLTERVCVPAPAARKRYVFLRGRLRAVPSGPLSLLSTDLFGAQAKWRLLREPFVEPRPPDAPDESVLDFGVRRLGTEAAHALIEPAVIGLFAGDAARLSMKSAFPRVAALEATHGSLLRGLRAARRQGAGPGKSVSFPDGLEEIPRALAKKLEGHLVPASVQALLREPGGWRVELGGGALSGPAPFDALVLALPPRTTAALLAPWAPEPAKGLRELTLASVVVVSLGFNRTDVGMDLGGYGFLVARGERPTLLGCQYESTVFPGRAPQGSVLLRAILGGTFEPEVLGMDDTSIMERTVNDLRLMGLSGQPDFAAVWRLPDVLPQYELGHEKRVQAIEAALANVPRLHVLGIGLRGIGLSDCIRNAAALARTIGPARA
jgi:protoporphyrinogen/coproporphyrinogen III oxidase